MIVNIPQEVSDFVFDNDAFILEDSWGVVRIIDIKLERGISAFAAQLIAKLIKFNQKLEIASAFALPNLGNTCSQIIIFREKNKKSSKKSLKKTKKNSPRKQKVTK